MKEKYITFPAEEALYRMGGLMSILSIAIGIRVGIGFAAVIRSMTTFSIMTLVMYVFCLFATYYFARRILWQSGRLNANGSLWDEGIGRVLGMLTRFGSFLLAIALLSFAFVVPGKLTLALGLEIGFLISFILVLSASVWLVRQLIETTVPRQTWTTEDSERRR